MTRETKIGLLVGLAFIIVIGVLLSDHIQSATEPQRALLSGASDVLRKGIGSPGNQSPGAVSLRAPEHVEPTAQVATQDSLSNDDKAASVIKIGPPDVSTTPDAASPTTTTAIADAGNSAQLGSGSANFNVPGVMAPGPAPVNFSPVTPAPVKPVEPPAPPVVMTKYVAVSGDSIYKMTVKAYGTYSKSKADQIVKANPVLAKSDLITVGQTYLIPNQPKPVDASAVASASKSPATPTPKPTSVKPASDKPSNLRMYTVKDGDSLWKIASAQGHSVAELRALNKDLLKGGDLVHPGMKLKIPADRLASAGE